RHRRRPQRSPPGGGRRGWPPPCRVRLPRPAHARFHAAEPVRIGGVLKTAYALATPGGVEWAHDPRRTVGKTAAPDLDPCRRPARHRGERRRPRPRAASVVLRDGRAAYRRPWRPTR